MKICAVVAEYNPLHNGHVRLLTHIKEELNADKIIVIMSGDFCERGENAVLDKYTRAKHAIYAGADMVIELPTVFSVANAEIFATGAVKLLNDSGIVNSLCFGVESGDANTYLCAAKAMLNETKEFKKILKKHLDTGVSLAKAKFNTVKELSLPDLDENLVSSPNNVLALEYTKAIIKLGAEIEISPYLRNTSHNDEKLYKNLTSAQSIRLMLEQGYKRKVKSVMPKYVFNDLPKFTPNFKPYIVSSLITSSAEELAKTPDCSEGLENRIKALLKTNADYDELIEKTSTKRYTKARIRRIMLANFLKIEEDFVFKCLKSPLYLKVLATNSTDLLAELKSKSAVPVLTRKSDYNLLDKTALECFEKDVTANDVYGLITGNRKNEFYTQIIDKLD